ncbi:hypothetical protein IOD16_01595 [Saccharothrix sp. 6-C]|uniref:hypothetical protein n=1 Tax=Saccharothrix sp. 6-C TaxID=2781735 RepID=UPI001917248B|nr:hypothetical protein [Saccharothrix sp. 6-C]QQQ77277.1 hypothetical protein IOD16_01595 [Saccharothrix sp. 6-C]
MRFTEVGLHLPEVDLAAASDLAEPPALVVRFDRPFLLVVRHRGTACRRSWPR